MSRAGISGSRVWRVCRVRKRVAANLEGGRIMMRRFVEVDIEHNVRGVGGRVELGRGKGEDIWSMR